MIPKKGFTLIELLVVIAIIGILASIVLVSLSGARNKAKDARITSSLGQMRTTGEIIYDTDGNYAKVACGTIADPCVCAGSTDIQTLCTDIYRQGGTDLAIRIGNSATCVNCNFCAVSKLNSGGYWCVDSGLKSERLTAASTTCVVGCVAGGNCLCD
jgi:prepilin-type N-terminal cleavage/methylation domain-containing protein